MASNTERFKPQNQTTQERLTTSTVGLVKLSEFRKRRAEVLEDQEREAREAMLLAADPDTSTPPSRSQTGTPAPAEKSDADPGPVQKKKKKAKTKGSKLSFADGDEDEEEEAVVAKDRGAKEKRLQANVRVGIVPKALTKAALRREAAEREESRREFLQIQDAVKATEIAIPFIFYDGTNIPGGTVRVKKGDFVWVFLDKSRKVGAERGVGEKTNSRREWAMISVDDLMLVRGTIIVPPHYDFHFFIINQTLGPGGIPLFQFSAEAPKKVDDDDEDKKKGGLMTAAEAKAAAHKSVPDISNLEGASDDPAITKVVDRRWYERNKHIYPASSWQEFDPDVDYVNQIRRDAGGNSFFYAR
jgi:protein FAM50